MQRLTMSHPDQRSQSTSEFSSTPIPDPYIPEPPYDTTREVIDSAPDAPVAEPEERNAVLEHCPKCKALLDVSGCHPLMETLCPTCGALIKVLREFHHFVLLSQLGQGGAGNVYRCFDETLERDVALKLLRNEHTRDEEYVAGLEREARITASINHPHVVKVYSTGWQNGHYYIAMEIVGGGTLAEKIRRANKMPEADVLGVAIQLAEGLGAAYDRGLLHRDIKPGNVLFANDSSVKLVDFGLALPVEHAVDDSDEIWGTPDYIAPEKLVREGEDQRSDIYSLGCTLFHCLAGRPPFAMKPIRELIEERTRGKAPSIRALVPEISVTTERILARMLATSPAHRFQNYTEVVTHLRQAQAEIGGSRAGTSKAAETTKSTAPTQAKPKRKVNKAAMAIAAVGAVGVCTVAVGLFLRLKPGQAKPSDTVVAASRAAQEASEAMRNALRPGLTALQTGDERAAYNAFNNIREHARRGSREAEWARAGMAVSLLAEGRCGEAASVFRTVPSEPAGEDPAQRDFVLRLGKALIAPQSDPLAAASKFDQKSYEGLAWLLLGLRGMGQGEMERGAEVLTKFQSSTPPMNDAWITDFQAFAGNVLSRYNTARDNIRALSGAQTGPGRASAMDALKQTPALFALPIAEAMRPHMAERDELARKAEKLPEDGLYQLVQRRTGQCLQVEDSKLEKSVDTVLAPYQGAPNQQWIVKHLGGNTYRLSARHSGAMLDVKSAATEDNGSVVQYEWNGSPAQLWHIEPLAGGYYTLLADCSGRALVGPGGNRKGAFQYRKINSDDQQWRLVKVGEAVGMWSVFDIGGPEGVSSTLDSASGAVTLKTGKSGLAGKEDGFRFVSGAMSGDGSITARVTSVAQPDSSYTAGILVRMDDSPGSPEVFLGFSNKGEAIFKTRNAPGAEITRTVVPGIAGPWVRISRKGDTFTAEASTDGKGWKVAGNEQMSSFGAQVQAGLALTSNARGAEATFDEIRANSDIQSQKLDHRGTLSIAGSPAVVSAAPKDVTNPVNLIRDPSFESQADNGPFLEPWYAARGDDKTIAVVQADLSLAHSGRKAAKLQRRHDTPNGEARLSTTFATEPRTDYVVSVWVYATGGFNADRHAFLEVATSSPNTDRATVFQNAESWTNVKCEFNSGDSNCATLSIGFLSRAEVFDTMWIDDVSVLPKSVTAIK